jgi:hypothetical protein
MRGERNARTLLASFGLFIQRNRLAPARLFYASQFEEAAPVPRRSPGPTRPRPKHWTPQPERNPLVAKPTSKSERWRRAVAEGVDPVRATQDLGITSRGRQRMRAELEAESESHANIDTQSSVGGLCARSSATKGVGREQVTTLNHDSRAVPLAAARGACW